MHLNHRYTHWEMLLTTLQHMSNANLTCKGARRDPLVYTCLYYGLLDI